MGHFLSFVSPFRGENIVLKSNVIIDGPVHIEEGVKIFENTKIVGPCYIGKNTIIGNNVMIRESHIGSDCVVGFNSDIARSYIGDNCWFHSNYVGDSVLEENISMGSGAVLANVRLDEEDIYSKINDKPINTNKNKLASIIGSHVRIGSNATVMPGIKIGGGSFVGAGVVLDKDLTDKSFCMVTPSYTVTQNRKSTENTNREKYRSRLR